jgi:hypothetical protein
MTQKEWEDEHYFDPGEMKFREIKAKIEMQQKYHTWDMIIKLSLLITFFAGLIAFASRVKG